MSFSFEFALKKNNSNRWEGDVGWEKGQRGCTRHVEIMLHKYKAGKCTLLNCLYLWTNLLGMNR